MEKGRWEKLSNEESQVIRKILLDVIWIWSIVGSWNFQKGRHGEPSPCFFFTLFFRTITNTEGQGLDAFWNSMTVKREALEISPNLIITSLQIPLMSKLLYATHEFFMQEWFSCAVSCKARSNSPILWWINVAARYRSGSMKMLQI